MGNKATEKASGAKRETFIPVTRFALMDTLAKEVTDEARRQEIASFFRFLGQWRHQEHQERLLRLKECYLPFSPDRDTVRVLEFSAEELDDLQARLTHDIAAMLERANYTHVDEDELNRLLSTHSAYGLEMKVDRSEFDEIMIFFRGVGEEALSKRDWSTRFRKRTVTVPTFKRLFLLLKLKTEDDRVREIMAEKQVSEAKAKKIVAKIRKQLPKAGGGHHIYLKLFKNIPQEDLEMMFPNTQVRFPLFAKIKLGVTAGGGTAAGVAGAASKAMAAVATANPLALAGSIFGVVAVVTRQVMNFFNTRNRYMLMLAKRLYFHSLADNRGALTLLSDRGEEEDVKEELLLYHFLLAEPVARDRLYDLDERIEDFLTDRFGVRVDFDMYDALERLERDGLVREQEGSGHLQVLSPSAACRALENKWRSRLAEMNGWIPQQDLSEV